MTEFAPPRNFYRDTGKAILDKTLIILALPIVLPLLAIVIVLASLDGHGPFYRQKRVGRHGKVFNLLKIRTMVPNADQILESYLAANPEARQEWEFRQKLYDDPRVTRIGAFIRKSSMDELPQLWNVLRGDMSLVGPRPMMVEQQDLYPGLPYYCRMRPGITGLWQITDRNESSFAERAIFDAEYFRRLSLKADLSILLRTAVVVFRGTGC